MPTMFILQKRARMDFIHKGHAGEYIYLGDYPVKGIHGCRIVRRSLLMSLIVTARETFIAPL